jgi:DNA-binding NarL/FixJ family response regulator
MWREHRERRALIIDDDAGSIEIARAGLQSSFEHIELATSVDTAVEALLATPTTVLLDVKLAFEQSGAILKVLERLSAIVDIIATSANATLAQIIELQERGISKFTQKPFDPMAVMVQIERPPRAVPAMGRIIAPSAAAQLMRIRDARGLTPAEEAILGCALLRMTYDEIALARNVTLNTVKTQIKAVLAKLGVSSLQAATESMYTRSAPVLGATFSLSLHARVTGRH